MENCIKTILTVTAMALPLHSAFAEAFRDVVETDGLRYEITKTDDGSYVASAKGLMSGNTSDNLVIPDFILYGGLECPVTSIQDNAFRLHDFDGITLGGNLKWIGRCAFEHATVDEIIIPPSLSRLYEKSLPWCERLTVEDGEEPLTITPAYGDGNPEKMHTGKVTTLYMGRNIHSGSVSLMNNVSSLTIGESVTEIGGYLFGGARGLRLLTLPEGVETIGDGAFMGAGMTDLELPASVTMIGEYAFANSNLDFIRVCGSHENGEVNIRPKAFQNVSFTRAEIYKNAGRLFEDSKNSLQYVKIGGFVTNPIDFEGCGRLETVVFEGGNLREIGGFGHCVALKKITIPEGVETVRVNAFYGCSSLEKVEFPSTLTSFDGTGQFNGCGNIKTVVCHGGTPAIQNYGYGFLPFDDDVYGTATLYVPAGSLDLYKSSDVWKNFYKMEEETGVGMISSENGFITVIDGRLASVDGSNPLVQIIAENGQTVYEGLLSDAPELGRGLYIFCVERRGSMKIII